MLVCTPIELMFTIWPERPLAHDRQQLEDQLHGPEVVELHGPLEVVEAVVGEGDRAPDRAAGVVDQDVDVAVLGEDLVGHPVDVVDVGEIARVDVRGALRRRRSAPGSPRASRAVRATSSTMPPASAILSAAERPIPDEAPVTITTLPRTACWSETVPRNRRPTRRSSSGICCSMIWVMPPTAPARP